MQAVATHYLRMITPHLIRFQYPILGALIIGVFGYSVFRIDAVLQTERDEEAFTAQQVEIKEVKFDSAAAEQIRNLERSEAEIKAQLEANRQNPFQ